MKPFAFEPARGSTVTFARPAPDYVNVKYLTVADTSETETVPTGAKVAIFSATNDFYAKANAAADAPSADVTDGSGSELNPAIWSLEGVATIGISGSAADTIVTISYYGKG